MKKSYLKLMVLSIGVFCFMSCSSQKSTAQDTTNAPQAEQKRGQGNNQQGKQGRGGERPTYAKLLAEMDQNKDGKLSKDEVKGRLKNDFTKVDTNSDGFISEAEFKNAPKPERKGPRQN